MTSTQLTIPLDNPIRVHTKERTEETTAHVQANAKKFGGNCMKLLQHWQKSNIPLSDDKAREWLGVRNLAQRCADLRNSGIVILSDWDETHTYKLYRLACQCPEPKHNVTGCYLHDQNLNIK